MIRRLEKTMIVHAIGLINKSQRLMVEQLNDVSVYGNQYKKTTAFQSVEIQIKWIELKVAILFDILKTFKKLRRWVIFR